MNFLDTHTDVFHQIEEVFVIIFFRYSFHSFLSLLSFGNSHYVYVGIPDVVPQISVALCNFSVCVCVCTHARTHALSGLSCVRLFAPLWTVAHQAPLSKGFSRQKYWSGSSCPPPGDLPGPGVESMSLVSPALAGRFSTTSATRDAQVSS